jgi:hypothetical protein
MKKIILPLLLSLGLGLNIQAQDQRFEAMAEFSADYICNCVNTVYADVDVKVKDILIKMYAMPEDEQIEYVDGLSEELKDHIEEQSKLISSKEKAAELDACGEKMIEELEDKFVSVKSLDRSEEELIEKMLEVLSKKKQCKFAYLLIQMGMGEENYNSEEIIDDNNGGGGEERQ